MIHPEICDKNYKKLLGEVGRRKMHKEQKHFIGAVVNEALTAYFKMSKEEREKMLGD